ncbi:MAG: DNA methyltransferase [Ignavibacteriales bacterium]|nr:DNA methyltransferase [Ignavibacteriales bacterium]
MPFENEFASYEPLRRILENPKVKALQNRLKIRTLTESHEEIQKRLTELSKIKPSDFQPDLIIAIDGSHHEVKIENGFPGAEIGYITVASVLLFLDKVREHSKEEFISRWLRFGPYYAMFPMEFAFKVIEKYSELGDYIIDPFFGRGTSIIAASVLERKSLGIEINPLGWLYTQTKLHPASKDRVLSKLDEINDYSHKYKDELKEQSRFFRLCFCDDVLKFLISARKNLNWKKSKVDATLMSFILVYLHGKIGEGLSNQMKMTKSMGYNYSIEWWLKNGYEKPPVINPSEFLKKRIEWRYEKGKPNLNHNKIFLADASTKLNTISQKAESKKYSLLFTSPPYWSITNYHVDQWLRLWLLGGAPRPTSLTENNKGRFLSKQKYMEMLQSVFASTAKMMKRKSIIYVRTDAREFTFNITKEVLQRNFPNHKLQIKKQPLNSHKTQTQLFGDKSEKPGEVDIILKRN